MLYYVKILCMCQNMIKKQIKNNTNTTNSHIYCIFIIYTVQYDIFKELKNFDIKKSNKITFVNSIL